jgi:hypothetical protein
VQEDNQGPLAGLDVVQLDIADFGVALTQVTGTENGGHSGPPKSPRQMTGMFAAA